MFINRIAFKQLVAGILTRIPYVNRIILKRFYKNTGGTIDADYCLLVWGKHIDLLLKNNWKPKCKSVLELGPGDSLGVGIVAVLSGVKSYCAVDVLSYDVISKSILVLNQLKGIIESGQTIEENEKIKPHFDSTAEWVNKFLINLRQNEDLKLLFSKIELDLNNLFDTNYKCNYIKYLPLDKYLTSSDGRFDLIFSQSVLEYIGELVPAFQKMHVQLNSNGWISHEVDLSCMRTSDRWDGHWSYPNWLWKIMKGKRPFFINRFTCDFYSKELEKSIWRNVKFLSYKKAIQTPKNELAKDYKILEDETLQTASIYFIAQKAY